MGQRWTLTIEHWHPTPLNQFVGSWRAGLRPKKRDREMVTIYTWQAKIPRALGKRRLSLHIVLGKGQRACDPDNYLKSLGDACVHAGVLVDDSRRYVEWAPVTFTRDWQQWGTVLTVEEIDDQS